MGIDGRKNAVKGRGMGMPRAIWAEGQAVSVWVAIAKTERASVCEDGCEKPRMGKKAETQIVRFGNPPPVTGKMSM